MTAMASPIPVDAPRHQTHYDLLEVAPWATQSEIAEAYHRARAAFAPDSLATYTLFSPEEAQLMLARMETAFLELSDVHERERYDHGLASGARGEDRPAPDPLQNLPDTSATTLRLEEGAPRSDGEPPRAVPGAAPQDTPVITRGLVNDILADTDQCDGQAILRLREARGVTLDEINLSTKISLMNLRFIEEDKLAALPAPVYLRGYLKQIAQYLNVDADWVVTGYMARFESQPAGIR